MSERPFMPMHVGGFVASTLALTTEEIGAYTLLLISAWQQGGSLPADTEVVRKIARLSPAVWADAWPSLSQHFEIGDCRLVPIAFAEWVAAKARLFGRTPLPKSVREAVLGRDGEVCRYCGSTDGPFHIDHIVAVANGGTDAMENLGVACKTCNLSKGAKPLEEWL